MSSVSQTPPRVKGLPGGYGLRFAIWLALIAGAVAVAVGPALPGVAAQAFRARPHAPDWALLGALPLAIKLHLAAALAALALGAVLMSRRKGHAFHRAAGWTWVGLVSVVAGSSLFITALRPGHFSILHAFTGWTFIALPLAVVWARRHQVAHHRRTMTGLFYGGFALNLFFAFIPGRTLWMLVFG